MLRGVSRAEKIVFAAEKIKINLCMSEKSITFAGYFAQMCAYARANSQTEK
jgi:hypothetical protein